MAKKKKSTKKKSSTSSKKTVTVSKKKKCDCRDWGLLLLRVVIAGIFLYRGWPKAMDWQMAAGKFASMGFAGALGGPIGVLEVVAAIAILVGAYHRYANYLLAAIIAVAIIGVQLPAAAEAGKLLTSSLERDVLILAGTLLLAWTGPGKYVLKT